MKSTNINYKKRKFSLGFKQIFNEYIKHQRSLKLDLELVYNPNKLFIEDIYKKKRNYDLQKENMNIVRDLFDGKMIDIDQQKYLNNNSKYEINFLTHSSSKISQFLLFKNNGNFLDNKKKIIHKSFSYNTFGKNNLKKRKLKFPKIFIQEEKAQDEIKSNERKNITINTNNINIDENKNYNFKIIFLKNMKYRKSFISLKKYIPKDSKIFNSYKIIYYNKMKTLTTESKIISKNLSNN